MSGRRWSRRWRRALTGSRPFEAGRYVVLERVADYWGRNLPVNVGENNFDRIRFEYFRDETVLRQALKAGVLDFRVENQAKAWALDYDIPAVRHGWLQKVEFPHERPAGLQAFVFNTRRPMFADRRVREALGYAFDFEWTNRVLFFGQYKRATSYFNNSEMASRGVARGRGAGDPGEVPRARARRRSSAAAYPVPVTDGSGWPRGNLLKALDLLRQAGWVVRDMRLVNEQTGEPMRFEILDRHADLRAHHAAVRAQPEAHRHRGKHSPRRPVPVRQPPACLRFRHGDAGVGPVGFARATSSATSGAPRRRNRRDRTTIWGSAIRWSTS